MKKKICIVGMGNMGQAIFEALKQNSYEVLECRHEDDFNKKLEDCEVVSLILAGMSIGKIQEKLKVEKVVRTLPNLPLKVGRAFTIWMTSSEIPEEEKDFVKNLLRSFGAELEIKEEEKINSLGAISG